MAWATPAVRPSRSPRASSLTSRPVNPSDRGDGCSYSLDKGRCSCDDPAQLRLRCESTENVTASQLSADGSWWWDGTQWLPAISGDGKWRWDGQRWLPNSPDTASNIILSTPPRNVHVTDISHVVLLRKRVGRAAFSAKIIGFFSGFIVLMAGFTRVGAWAIPVSMIVFCVSYWLSNQMRSGRVYAAISLAAWLSAFATWDVFVAVPPAVRDYITGNDNVFFVTVGLAAFNLPIYFLARGLIARLVYGTASRGEMSPFEPLTQNPWVRVVSRTRFLNKRSLAGYALVVLIPFVLLVRLLTAPTETQLTEVDHEEQIGRYAAELVIGLAVWLLVAFLYRTARRYSMLPAGRLAPADKRSPVLYLRSFRDDAIKLWARASDGRIFLERLFRISFEELITDHLWRYGRVVAIGDPSRLDSLAALGAARDFVPGHVWQQKAVAMMQDAKIIAAVVSSTSGFLWEMDTIVKLGLVSRLILLIPPVPTRDVIERWDQLRVSVASLQLPPDLDAQRTRAVVFAPDHVVLVAGRDPKDWTYEAAADSARIRRSVPIESDGRFR
jgi:hypothetical protein